MALPPPGDAAWLMTRTGSDQYGPYTLAQLAAYIAEGRILPGDGVWHHGATVRLNANQLPAFGVAAPAPVPAAPIPAPLAPAPVPVEPAAAPVAPVQPAPVPPAPVAEAQVYAAPAYAAATQGNKAGLHIKRAFNWNLRSLPVEADEEGVLIANGVDEADARRYLVWRRSVLFVVVIPAIIAALLKTIGMVTQGFEGISGTGILIAIAELMPLYIIALTAWLAAKCWDQHRRSRSVLMRGWLIAFLAPLLLALIPFGWRVDTSSLSGNQLAQMNIVASLAGAAVAYVTLMPAVLSLIPGVLRACLRIKALIPEAILPGLFLIAATPLYVFLFLVIFTTINQVIGDVLLILGVLALVGAPMFYMLNARSFTRPLRTEEEIAKIGSVQNLVLLVGGIGVALLVVYAFMAEPFGRALIGTDPQTSAIRPWDPNLFQFPIEYIVRSLFTTVLVADLFMMMNLQLWKHTKEFQASADAASYDQLMVEIEEAGYTAPSQPTAQQQTT
ncbi:MAG TPA: hypothetical protein VEC11_10930 [Allosphingosinicella sp.]|nr:hypothetical protein [Allosphingosinicella sp.]